jgi:uncharacterized protein YuzE
VDEIPERVPAETVTVDPEQVGGAVTIDIDDGGHIIGIEILDATALLPADLLPHSRV